MNNSTRVRTNT